MLVVPDGYPVIAIVTQDRDLIARVRGVIADAIAQAGIDNLIMVSGDAHMVALDDGTNSDYSTGGGASFPVFHAAPLDRPGSIKGGPYSDGTFDGAGQFGLLDIADEGDDDPDDDALLQQELAAFGLRMDDDEPG